VAFATLTAVFLTVGYSFIGAAWLIGKTDGLLQVQAVTWARGGIWGLVLGIAAVSAATPFVSTRIFDKWFAWPEAMWLSILPLASVGIVAWLWMVLRRLPDTGDRGAWMPFVLATLMWVLAFVGMAYSFYPYVVPERLTIYEAASAPESLWIILVGTMVVLPTILAYTAVAYAVFRGKATTLSYD
jgi:cytochrome d ubiquinol oxidase subunit II